MYILGLSTMTESAATLMKDGQVVAAAEEERFSRVKHDGGFPYLSIAWVLSSASITLDDVDHIAVYWNPYKLGSRMRYMLKTLFSNPSMFIDKARRALTVWQGESGEDSGWGSLFGTEKKLDSRFPGKPRNIHFLDHHECHMASCYFASDFEDAAILIMDGAGEAACTTWGHGTGDSIKKTGEHLLPHSLGHFYSSITGFLGFKMLDGEYKLMGLSPYGDPGGADWMNENYLISNADGTYQLNTGAMDYHRAMRGNFSGSFTKHFGESRECSETAEFNDRHRDIAASAQRAFENVVLSMGKALRKQTGADNLVIAGGCGLNCTANGRLLTHDIFDKIYVPPVPHDAGGSLGAAMVLYKQLTGKRPESINHAQFGPSYSNEEIGQVLVDFPGLIGEQLTEVELLKRAAKLLSGANVICWMQGPMEFGPRALGNRSFLADPRSDSIRDVINEKIKKRELFRPFAPSVKAERASEYFQIEQPSPFMTIIVPVHEDKREAIPAVTHIDGTARPQTVDKTVNPRYWKLLDAFEEITGVPILLNTSFNIQEPIICSPREAMATFSNSGVDALVIGDYWVTKSTGRA